MTQRENAKVEQEDREVELLARKQLAQRRMAWTALATIIIFTIIIATPIIPEDRLVLLLDIADLFYISMAGIVGAFMGFNAYMARK